MRSSLTVKLLTFASDYVGQTITRQSSKPLLLWWSDGYIIWTNLISDGPGPTSTLFAVAGSFKRVEDGVRMLRCTDPPIEEADFPICYRLSPNTSYEEFSKHSLCEAGRHPRQASLLTIPYVHRCSHCNLQAMGCRSSCPAPSEDEMDYEKQVRSVHDRDDSSSSNGCLGR